ncbi:hypothetical protein SFUMM280S_07079 [Streptomyces fumanus]
MHQQDARKSPGRGDVRGRWRRRVKGGRPYGVQRAQFPERTARRAAVNPASKRRLKPICTGTSRPATAFSTWTASAMVRATGFSQNTGTPAATPAPDKRRVRIRGRRDDQPVHPGGQQRPGGVHDPGPEPLGGGPRGPRHRIADDEGLDRAEPREGLGMEDTDPTETEDADAHGVLLTGPCGSL